MASAEPATVMQQFIAFLPPEGRLMLGHERRCKSPRKIDQCPEWTRRCVEPFNSSRRIRSCSHSRACMQQALSHDCWS